MNPLVLGSSPSGPTNSSFANDRRRSESGKKPGKYCVFLQPEVRSGSRPIEKNLGNFRYLLVTPKGGRYGRFAYRFARKHKTLSLGTYPVITPEWARSRREFARNLLAQGMDPSALKAALGRPAFAAMMREWAIERGHLSALPLSVAEAIRVLRL